jgi:hypothetical protein
LDNLAYLQKEAIAVELELTISVKLLMFSSSALYVLPVRYC